jgi:hypothetical protein
LNIPVKEGRVILARVMSALLDAPECYIPVRGPWVPLSDAQQANWDARQTIGRLKREGFAELEEIDETLGNTPMVDASHSGSTGELLNTPALEQSAEGWITTVNGPGYMEKETSARVLVEAKQATLFS